MNLEIAEDPSFEKYLNQYDVLYLDITWFISNSKNIREAVLNLQEEVIEELRETYSADRPNTGSLTVELARIGLGTGRRFIVIIDEWDALFREARTDTDLQEEYIRLLRGLFKSNQTDNMIEAAYMTGILRNALLVRRLFAGKGHSCV